MEFPANVEEIPAAGVADADDVTGARFRQHIFGRRASFNHGFAARRILSAGAKDVTMMLPLADVFGFVRDIERAFLGVKFGLRLIRASAENSIHRADCVDAGHFQIKHLSLCVPMIKPALAVQTALEAKVVAGSTRQLYF
ncbi:MAG: hypothetical protein AB2556_23440 [Candidatus Thiodiazotropha sp.]